MLTQSRFAYLIEISQKIIGAVQSMMAGYRGFPALISEEHEMVKAHTYTDRLEEIIQAKVELGEKISVSFEELQQLSQQLFSIWSEAECEGQAAYPGDLSNCVAMLEGIFVALKARETGFSMGVLELQVNRVKEVVLNFKAMMAEVKPQLELNRIAITQVSQNYQASTRALIEMCEQAQATYSPTGQQTKRSTGTSTIFVKA